MPQSLSKIYIHMIFSTKGRHPLIKKEIKDELHKYIAGALKNLDSPALLINSVEDHIHILFRMSKNFSISKIVEEIKKQSSKWVKDNFTHFDEFAWQNGYACFSVSSSKIDTVKNYIHRQEEHHKKTTFKEEIEKFMEKYRVEEYHEVYFWD